MKVARVACLGFVPLLLCLPLRSFAISPLTLSGGLAGIVRDASGSPQMGATVTLYDASDKLLERVFTSEHGAFSFGGLAPNFYSIRVSLASFLPALRDRIRVEIGMKRLLEVNLSTLFSSIQFAAPEAGGGALMTDDWKWAVRASTANRPVLRILPASTPSARGGSIFTDSRGLMKVSGGDASFGENADVGTSFAFATSLYGVNQLQLSGNLGYVSGSGLPATGFRASYSREFLGGTPEVSLTMRQISLPNLSGSVPRLRTMAAGFKNKTAITDSLDLEYGFEMDSVSYVDQLQYFSPYARLIYHAGDRGDTRVDFTWTSGNGRPEMGAAVSAGDVLERDVSALARLPRISLRDGHDRVQRGEDYELGVSHTFGSRDYRISAYRESVRNAALTVASPGGDLFPGDIIPDLFSNTAVFDAGDYRTLGYTASVTQNLLDHYKLTLIYGSVGVLTAGAAGPIADADELRNAIRATRREAVTTQMAGTAPVAGTRFFASYQWTDYRAATSGHLFASEPGHPEPGLNVWLRQPVPGVPGLPGRMELTGDFTNMLAQGYLPFSLADGRKLLLMRTPRSFRGGLSFIF